MTSVSSKRKREDTSSAVFKHDGPPWLVHGKHYSKGIMGLHEELVDFYNLMKPTADGHQRRLEVFTRIQEAIVEIWPDAKVQTFGSFNTKLYPPNSDIDIVVEGKWDVLPLRTVARILLEKGIADPANTEIVDRAFVPIVKIVDIATKINIDIVFNATNGVDGANLINNFIEMYPTLPPLVFVLKQFLSQAGLNKVYEGGISSYSLILLTVNFLQLHPRPDATHPEANLGILLLEFLELYGRHFNYDKVGIRVGDGGSYFPKEEMKLKMPKDLKQGFLCIEDPITPSIDATLKSFGAESVRNAFEFAYATLTHAIHPTNHEMNDPNVCSILGRIIRLPEEFRRPNEEGRAPKRLNQS